MRWSNTHTRTHRQTWKNRENIFFFRYFSLPPSPWTRSRRSPRSRPPPSFLSSHSISKILFDTIKTVPVFRAERKAYPFSHRLKWFKWQRNNHSTVHWYCTAQKPTGARVFVYHIVASSASSPPLAVCFYFLICLSFALVATATILFIGKSNHRQRAATKEKQLPSITDLLLSASKRRKKKYPPLLFGLLPCLPRKGWKIPLACVA